MQDMIFKIVIIGSWVLAPAAMFVLISRRKYRRAATFGVFILAVPAFLFWVFSVKDDHLRKWLNFPTALLLVMWTFAGFWLCNAAWGSQSIDHEQPRRQFKDWVTRPRRFAAVAVLVGASIWLFGATHPEIGAWGMWSSVALIGSVAMMSFGLIGLLFD